MVMLMTPKATASNLRLGGRVDFWITPVPAARPRVGKFGTYYPPKYAKFRKEFSEIVDRAGLPSPRVTPVGMYFEFVLPRPANPANPYPMGDTDNYVKAVLDVLQGRAYVEDDKQVVFEAGFKRYAAKGERPHITVLIGDMADEEDVLQQFDTISLEELHNE